MVSVPTSRRPIEAVGISYFSSRFLVTAFSRGCPHRRSAYTLYLRACVEAERTGQEERVDVFAVVAKGHLVGSEANGVLAGRDAVKLFEVSLVDASQRRVDLDGVWMDDETRIGKRSIRLFRPERVSNGGLSSSLARVRQTYGYRRSAGEWPGSAGAAGSERQTFRLDFFKRRVEPGRNGRRRIGVGAAAKRQQEYLA